ncbi:MAG: TRAP transporter permease, partial [Oscillospiraceae bacterium]|nr:TRAP transporter permease [Oscillospiraceae bacterium]
MDEIKNEKTLEAQVEDASVGTAADVDAVMKKYDRESNTRVWEGTPKLIVRVLGILFSCYCIFSTLKGWPTLPEQKLNLFLGFILIMGYLH